MNSTLEIYNTLVCNNNFLPVYIHTIKICGGYMEGKTHFLESSKLIHLLSLSQGHGAHGSSAEGRNLRLLVFDPSHSKAHMATLSKSSPTSAEAGQVMRMLRKAPASIKCKQYQIVTVGGVFATDKEAAMHKVISSKRVP